MFCSKCGKETNNKNYICDDCKLIESIVKKENKRIKKMKIMALISMILGIISCTGLLGYFGAGLGIGAIVLARLSKNNKESCFHEVGLICGIAGIVAGILLEISVYI